jgi:predicted nucleic-acid-binding protein
MKEFKYFIDSNIFLRPIVKDDSRKVKECEGLFEKIKLGEIKAFTSNLILAEIVWTGYRFYQIRKQELVKTLKGILGFKNLKIKDNFNPDLAIEIYSKLPVKFIDALIASNPSIFQKKIIVISYDKDFDKIGVKRIEPKEIIKERK